MLVQVETREALANIEAIAAVNGVDGIFVGPADLRLTSGTSASRGTPRCRRRSGRHRAHPQGGQGAGHPLRRRGQARRYLDLGALFVAVGVDTAILARETQALASRFKSG